LTQTVQNHKLDAGVLALTYEGQNAIAKNLFQVAERINPKRAFVFVSNVLGRHIPVKPSAHQETAEKLAQDTKAHLGDGPVLVMGYAETAVGFGAAVGRAIKNSAHNSVFYLPTTRHPVEGHDWLVFEEGHSHATDQRVMTPANEGFIAELKSSENKTLVLVDDESTTGNTFAGLALELKDNGLEFDKIVLVTLTDWSGGEAEKTVARAVGKDNVCSVSLFQGRWAWHQDPNAAQKVIPTNTPHTPRPAWTAPKAPESLYQAPRLGTDFSQDLSLDALEAAGLNIPTNGRVLVVGTGEHVWTPFLLAEKLEEKGLDSAFLATTRSPILPGEVIKEKAVFADHFGLGLPMYLHNVNPAEWDHIILMLETGLEGICPSLATFLPNAQVIDGNGQVHTMKDAQCPTLLS
jgi:orotate phosphoribosyltransferase